MVENTIFYVCWELPLGFTTRYCWDTYLCLLGITSSLYCAILLRILVYVFWELPLVCTVRYRWKYLFMFAGNYLWSALFDIVENACFCLLGITSSLYCSILLRILVYVCWELITSSLYCAILLRILVYVCWGLPLVFTAPYCWESCLCLLEITSNLYCSISLRILGLWLGSGLASNSFISSSLKRECLLSVTGI